jgi:hypothetical protein
MYGPYVRDKFPSRKHLTTILDIEIDHHRNRHILTWLTLAVALAGASPRPVGTQASCHTDRMVKPGPRALCLKHRDRGAPAASGYWVTGSFAIASSMNAQNFVPGVRNRTS